MMNFQNINIAPFGNFIPACLDSESSFKKISQVLDKLWLLSKLGLYSFITHKDVAQIERHIFVEQESRLYQAHFNERNHARAGTGEDEYFAARFAEIDNPALMEQLFLSE